MLRSTGILCGTNMTQTEMYEIRTICKAIQKNIETDSPTSRMDRLTIKSKARTLLTKCVQRQEAKLPRCPDSSEDDSDPVATNGPAQLTELPCGNTNNAQRERRCPVTNMNAIFRCAECRPSVCEFCKEQERHTTGRRECSPETWDAFHC